MNEYIFLSGGVLVIWWYGKRFRLLQRFADSSSQLGVTRTAVRRVSCRCSTLCVSVTCAYATLAAGTTVLPEGVAQLVAVVANVVRVFTFALLLFNMLAMLVLLVRRLDSMLGILLVVNAIAFIGMVYRK